MTAKFPLSEYRKPGSVYTYDPDINENYVNQSVITDKNLIDAYDKILRTTPASSDSYATKIRVNTHGVIVSYDNIKAADIPPHTHTSDQQGGKLEITPQIYTLTLTKGTKTYAIPNVVYKTMYGLFISGIFRNDFVKKENSEIEIQFDVYQNCEAQILYYD